jgi:hypothetical protein
MDVEVIAIRHKRQVLRRQLNKDRRDSVVGKRLDGEIRVRKVRVR